MRFFVNSIIATRIDGQTDDVGCELVRVTWAMTPERTNNTRATHDPCMASTRFHCKCTTSSCLLHCVPATVLLADTRGDEKKNLICHRSHCLSTRKMRLVLSASLFALAGFECAQAFQPNTYSKACQSRVHSRILMELKSSFYSQEDEEEDDDDDDNIDADSLGDWRAFRNSLLAQDDDKPDNNNSMNNQAEQRRSKANEQLLMRQNKQLGQEYAKGVWAHEVATPEVGGLVCRLPLEAEIYRNYRHNVIGQLLHQRLDKKHGTKTNKKQERPSAFFEDPENDSDYEAPLETAEWYSEAQKLVSDQMQAIALMADDGTVDATKLSTENSNLLQLFLDNQESWQEVCLVLERDESAGTATTVVLNRPMARKLSPDLAKLLIGGMMTSSDEATFRKDVTKLIMAFGNDIAVYLGGPDRQDQPAILVHGIKDLEGAEEISPGSNIYRGGLDAAIDGVLAGKYNPLDFRFFVGRHEYSESKLDLSVVLGKYQPVACARSLSLKQCIALPKPLWHEVFELCGGTLAEISEIELLKRDDLKFEVVEDDYGIVDDDDDFYRI